jgi:high-affinity iron transporter
VVIDSAILVMREGLETILVLAAVTASFRGANRVYRGPVAAGGGAAIVAGIATWFGVIWLIGQFHGGEYEVQAATGIPALMSC